MCIHNHLDIRLQRTVLPRAPQPATCSTKPALSKQNSLVML